MARQYTITYTPEILRTAVICYFRIIVGLWFPCAVAGFGAYVVYRWVHGDRSWVVGAGGAMVIIVTAVIGSLFVVHLRRAGNSAAELARGPVQLTVGDDELCFDSPLGVAKIPWAKVAAVHTGPRILLLQFKPGGYSSIPLAALDADGISDIKNRVRQAGANVA